MLVAVGKRELQRFGHDVDVLRRIMSKRLQVVVLQDIERHRQHRPLRPRAAGVHFDAVELRFHRRFEFNAELGEILHAHQAADFLVMLDDGCRDVALVERVARGAQCQPAPLAAVRFLDVGHVLQRAAEIGLHEHFAGQRRLAFGQEYFFARRIAFVRSLVDGDKFRHQWIHRKTFTGETNRRRRHFAEAHGAEALERRDPRIGRCRYYAAQFVRRYFPAVKFLEKVRRDRFRPDTEAVDAVDFLFLRQVHDQRRDAAKTHLVGLQHAHSDA